MADEKAIGAVETEELAPAVPAEAAAEGTAPAAGKKKKRRKLYEFTAENDMKYRGPLNYQSFQVLGWLCMVASVVVLVINIGGRIDAGVTAEYGKAAEILSGVADLALPFLLIANFSRILNNSEGYKKQLLRNGGAALAIFAVTVMMGSRYLIGTIKLMVIQKDAVEPMLTAVFQGIKQEGFLDFNLFIDLFMCTLTMYFLNARPKRVFTGRKIIILRLMTILPIAYEVACFWLKIQSATGKISLPLWSFPLLTVKPPMTFALFVFLAFLVKIREFRYCRHGRTHEEYLEFMKSNRNSFHFSVRLGLSLLLFAALDLLLFLVLGFGQGDQLLAGVADVTDEMRSAAYEYGMKVASAVGVGGSVTLFLVAPLMLLYSYNTVPKRKIISMLAPAVGIVLMILVILEAVRMGIGMLMAGREVDLEMVRDELVTILSEQPPAP